MSSPATGQPGVSSDPPLELDGAQAGAVPVTESAPMRKVAIHDLANVLTLCGGVLSVCGIFLILQNRISLAFSLNLLSFVFDNLDGVVAQSRSLHRTMLDQCFGANLDSLCDVISFALFPAFAIMQLSELSLVSVAVASVYVCGVLIRLAYFNTLGALGLSNPSYYIGLSADWNALALATLYTVLVLGQPPTAGPSSWSLMALMLLTSIVNTSSRLHIPKLRPRTIEFYATMGYALLLAVYLAAAGCNSLAAAIPFLPPTHPLRSVSASGRHPPGHGTD